MNHTFPCLLLLLAPAACAPAAPETDPETPPGCAEEDPDCIAATALPPPSGPHGVGVLERTWIDEGRPETLTGDPADSREVRVRIFYPADTSGGEETAPYIDPWIAGELGAAGTLAAVKTHAVTDAPVSAGEATIPLLLFSPGLGYPPELYTAILEDAASHGFAVAAMAHPSFSGPHRLLGGAAASDVSGEVPGKPELFQIPVADARFVLDKLQAEGAAGLLDGRVELDKVVALGHSYGGAVALETALLDERVIAAINLDGSVWGQIAGEGLTEPFVLILAGDHSEANDVTLGPLVSKAPPDAYRARLEQAAHDSFSDAPRLTGSGPPSDASTLTLKLTRLMARTFASVHLADAPPSALDDLAAAHPEMNLTRLMP